jgi:multiple sugar transport system substrate-binding protein
MRTTRPTRLLAVAAAVATVAVTAACGGGGGGGGTTGGAGAPDAAAPAACEPAAPGTKVDLTFTSWVPGMQKTVDLWNQTHPDIQVKYTEVVGGNDGTYQAYANQIKAGTTGDLGMLEFDSLPSFRLQNGLADIGACKPVHDGISQYPQWTQSQISFGEQGAVYGVPQDVGPLALYYRKDLFDAAGLKAPTTWDEYAQDAAAIQGRGALIGNFMPDQPAWFTALAWQNGARWFNVGADGTWKVDLTDPKTTQVADFWQKLIDAKQVNTIPGIGDVEWKALDSGQEWTLIGAPWTAKLIETNVPSTAGKWAVAPLPQWTAGGTAGGSWGGSATVVWAGSKHPYEAAQFAMWAFGDPAALALNNQNGGQFPAHNGQTSLPALSQPYPYFGNQVIWTDFAKANDQVDPSFTWGPTMTDTFDTLSNGFGQAVNGQQKLADVLKDAQARTIDTMKAQAIQVG